MRLDLAAWSHPELGLLILDARIPREPMFLPCLMGWPHLASSRLGQDLAQGT
jgi:hypothetical protein